MKRTLGDTGMTLKASKPIREPAGPSYGRGDRSDQSGDSKSRDRKGARRDQVDRNNQSETKKDSRERYDRHDRNNRDRNNRDQPDTRRDDQKREKRKHKNEERYENDRNMDQSRGSNSRTAPSPAAGSNSAGPEQTGSNRNEADRAGQTVPPKKTLEFVAAEPPRTNIWAERIKQKTVEEQKTRTRDQPHADGPRDHHDNRTNQSERKNDFFASKKEKDSGRKRSDRNRDQRKSRDTDHGSDVGGSKGNLAKFRENEKRKNEKRDFSGSNENVSRASKKRDQKKGGSNQRLNRLESKDEDEAPSKKPRRREDGKGTLASEFRVSDLWFLGQTAVCMDC